MTRRLEPLDRVRELGDASVPFPYDVHALFFSDDAVTLENDLHKAFAARRLNFVNERREFSSLPPPKYDKSSKRRPAAYWNSPSGPMPPSTTRARAGGPISQAPKGGPVFSSLGLAPRFRSVFRTSDVVGRQVVQHDVDLCAGIGFDRPTVHKPQPTFPPHQEPRIE
jgi:hypothetical protein